MDKSHRLDGRRGLDRRRTSPRGFTLVEMLVAFTLTTVAALAIVGIFPMGIASLQQSGDSLQAQAVGQQCLDQIREYYQTEHNPPPNFQPGTTYPMALAAPSSLNNTNQFRSHTQAPTSYTVSYTATNLASASAPTPEHDIVLTVTWTGLNGSHSRLFEEYVQN
ncbi:MAG: type II secretion system protein [Candidatus Eremiobacteraeota bacterium]|nr:type II secretion system protein [Candidatus Eremiobacteraeota bacterium]